MRTNGQKYESPKQVKMKKNRENTLFRKVGEKIRLEKRMNATYCEVE